MAVSARTILTASFQDLGVIAVGDSMPNEMAQDGLRRINNMVSAWQVQYGTTIAVERQVFDLVANIGGPDNPYSVGDAGDIDVPRPNTISGCGLLLNPGEDSETELPRSLMTDDAYQAIQVKNLSSSLFTGAFYNPTVPLGSLYLWPVPDNADSDLVLYLRHLFTGFADLNTEYDWPSAPGYAEAVQYQLDLRLTTPYGRELPPMIQQLANDAFGIIKRANNRLVDMASDAALLTHDRRGGYNIETSNQ